MDSVKEIHDIAKSNEMKKIILIIYEKFQRDCKVYYAHPVFERNSIGSNFV